MVTITIPKKEYQSLVEKAFRYEYLERIVKEQKNIFISPPVKNAKKIVDGFQSTGLYSQSFLRSMGKGLRRSNYFR